MENVRIKISGKNNNENCNLITRTVEEYVRKQEYLDWYTADVLAFEDEEENNLFIKINKFIQNKNHQHKIIILTNYNYIGDSYFLERIIESNDDVSFVFIDNYIKTTEYPFFNNFSEMQFNLQAEFLKKFSSKIEMLNPVIPTLRLEIETGYRDATDVVNRAKIKLVDKFYANPKYAVMYLDFLDKNHNINYMNVFVNMESKIEKVVILENIHKLNSFFEASIILKAKEKFTDVHFICINFTNNNFEKHRNNSGIYLTFADDKTAFENLDQLETILKKY